MSLTAPIHKPASACAERDSFATAGLYSDTAQVREETCRILLSMLSKAHGIAEPKLRFEYTPQEYGYFDSENNEIVLSDSISSYRLEHTLRHELGHAAQLPFIVAANIVNPGRFAPNEFHPDIIENARLRKLHLNEQAIWLGEHLIADYQEVLRQCERGMVTTELGMRILCRPAYSAYKSTLLEIGPDIEAAEAMPEAYRNRAKELRLESISLRDKGGILNSLWSRFRAREAATRERDVVKSEVRLERLVHELANCFETSRRETPDWPQKPPASYSFSGPR